MPKLVSEHISETEYACPHCGKVPPSFYDLAGEVTAPYTVLFQMFEEIRKGRGDIPLDIIRGYSCEENERANYEAWVLAGKSGTFHAFLDIHIFGLALDVQGISKVDQTGIVALARKLNPRPRIGWKQYQSVGFTSVHIDCAYLIDPLPSAKYVVGVEW